MRVKQILLFLVILLTQQTLIALTNDQNQPLNIISDKVTINYAKGISILEGNVKVTQGSTVLLGNKVVIYTDQHQQLIQLIAYGNKQKQASYETLATLKDSPFYATSDIITYIASEKRAIFHGHTHASDGVNQFNGAEFDYFTEEQRIVADKINNQRSTIIIYPGKKH